MSERTWRYPERGELPPDGRYVLIHVPDQPWEDRDDPSGCFYKVAKFVRGISQQERDTLPDDCFRKITIKPGDEHGNNKRSYYWRSFGVGDYFGQAVYRWAEIPREHDANDTGSIREDLAEDHGMCLCKSKGLPEHTCPYREDVDGDSGTLCNCCWECMEACADDI